MQKSCPLSVKGSFVTFVLPASHMHLMHMVVICVPLCTTMTALHVPSELRTAAIRRTQPQSGHLRHRNESRELTTVWSLPIRAHCGAGCLNHGGN
jgi:hypothetical protein